MNISFERALFLLEEQINDPSYLITLWKFSGRCHENVPYPETCSPWYAGLESLIILN